MDALKHIIEKFNIDLEQKSPIKLPIDRFRGLTGLFNELGFKVGAEIGVDNGRYSKWLCIKVKKLKLFCVDPWIEYEDYIESHNQNKTDMDTHYERAKTRLAKFNVEFVRKTSMEAVKDFKDNSLDFVFIDGNHTFEYVVNDIAEWSKKVKPGGIVSGHDYWRSIESKKSLYINGLTDLERLKLVQVKDAVDGWMKANQISSWFLTIGSTWFYVKQ